MWGERKASPDPDVPGDDDQLLIQRALAKDPGAVQALLHRLRFVPATIYSRHLRLGSPLKAHELEDVGQEVIAAVWNKLSEFGGKGRLESWVYGFCVKQVYRALHERRRESRREVVEDLDQFQGASGEIKDPYDYLQVALDTLGDPVATIIRLRHFDDLSFEKIGLNLGMPAGTAKTQYYRGLKRLRVGLEPNWRKEQP
ncbi:MAG: sigma-70 family RNA polymerase sigma factor [Planctomycetota bacterium]